jgi:hypothetical protein
VFKEVNLQDAQIEFLDELNHQDVGSVHRFKYTLKVNYGGTTYPSDPEIQNEREPRLEG